MEVANGGSPAETARDVFTRSRVHPARNATGIARGRATRGAGTGGTLLNCPLGGRRSFLFLLFGLLGAHARLLGLGKNGGNVAVHVVVLLLQGGLGSFQLLLGGLGVGELFRRDLFLLGVFGMGRLGLGLASLFCCTNAASCWLIRSTESQLVTKSSNDWEPKMTSIILMLPSR